MYQPRANLSAIFHGFTDHVYFQPPDGFDIKYPCIIYQIIGNNTIFANDTRYHVTKKYKITIIDRNPDSPISELVAAMKYTKFDTRFVSDNLYHDVYLTYF